MLIHPCTHCVKRKTCERKAAIHKQCRGLGISVARIACDGLFEHVPPGQRVSLALVDCVGETEGFCGLSEPDPPEPIYDSCQFTAIVMGRGSRKNRDKVKIWLDEPVGEGREIVHVHPDKLTPISQTTWARLSQPEKRRIVLSDAQDREKETLKGIVPICSECGRPDGKENSEEWSCWKCEGKPPPEDCVEFESEPMEPPF
jgi:hypothetical protein